MSKSKSKMGESITNAQWAAFRPDHPYPEGYDDKPVVDISYDDAMEYAGWLSRQTGRKFRLPTEDERKAAEDTFEADYSKHPLPECPDVGTFGRNADGVTGLKGTTWDWCLHPDDHNPEKLGWVTEKKETPPPVEENEALRKLLFAVETLRAAGIKVEL